MSTYYVILCAKHKECCPVASWTNGGVGAFGDSVSLLPLFIVAHHRCQLLAVSEHEREYDESHDDDWIDWGDASDPDELFCKDRDHED